ncbi:MAG TPA: CHAD domain-containing protein [Ktedonobacterales bacterium]|nr:CHAD domain-containing protein [Ktedonobacterales bacterium]
MEVEAKYAVIGPLDPERIAALDLGSYTVTARGKERHNDEILDTPDRALTTARQALRIRKTDEATLITLKGPNTVSGGVHAREEIERSLPADADGDPGRWPREIAEKVTPLLGDQRPGPLVRVDVVRHLWDVARDGERVAELALDKGAIYAGGRARPVHELELELKGAGERGDLDALTARLERALALIPEPRGKLERGLELLRPAGESGRAPVLEVGRRAIREQMEKLRKARPDARAGDDPEGVHDMRVATRRMRTMLDVLAGCPDADGKRLTRTRRRLKKPARLLGAVRDLDVLIAREEGYAADHPKDSDDLEAFHRVLLQRRQRARDALKVYLDGAKLDRILAAVDAFALDDGGAAVAGMPAVTVAQYAGGAIWARYEGVLRLAATAGGGEMDRLHQLRIACKRLRYTLELFERELGASAGMLIAALKRAQDELGALHDGAVERELLAPLLEKRTGSGAKGLVRYAAALDDERVRGIAACEPMRRYLCGEELRRQLAGLIGAL